jgi:hypothetical protein
VSSGPPHDAATASCAPPRGTSPRCYARCSEVSLSGPGIRPRYTCSAGQPAPRCRRQHGRIAIRARVPLGQCHDNRDDHPRSAHDRRFARGGQRRAGGAGCGVRTKIAHGPAVMDPGPGCRERRLRSNGPGRPRQGHPAGNPILRLAQPCLTYGGIVYYLLRYDDADQFAKRRRLPRRHLKLARGRRQTATFS